MCMSCALDIIVKLFSLSHLYELLIQLQVDIDNKSIDSKLKLRKLLPHVLSDVLSNENKRVCDGKGIVAKKDCSD